MGIWREIFSESNGTLSFTRITSATMIVWSLFLLAISVACKGGDLPSVAEVSGLLALIGFAVGGKVAQKPFESKETRGQHEDKTVMGARSGFTSSSDAERVRRSRKRE